MRHSFSPIVFRGNQKNSIKSHFATLELENKILKLFDIFALNEPITLLFNNFLTADSPAACGTD
jgi:hypothetical protein